jgi:hypothetical protein
MVSTSQQGEQQLPCGKRKNKQSVRSNKTSDYQDIPTRRLNKHQTIMTTASTFLNKHQAIMTSASNRPVSQALGSPFE